MPNQMTTKTSDDPRSGSTSTSTAGNAASSSEITKTRNERTFSSLSAKNFASMITVQTFAISDGCTCVPAMTIHRREPYALAPTTSTKSSPAIEAMYRATLSGPKSL